MQGPRPPIRHPTALPGGVALTVCPGPRGASLVHLAQRQPMRAVFPLDGDVATGVLVNTGGGLVGGDRLEVAVTLRERASLVVTTQAAEKVYRSAGAEVGIATRLVVGPAAHLDWLPQETILFDRSRLRRSLAIDLAPDATLLALEMVVFGRRARGERFLGGTLRDGWDLRVAGRLVWADRLRIEAADDAFASPFALDGAAAMATLVARPERPDLDAARSGLIGPGAVSRLGGLLVARFLGHDAAVVRAGVAATVERWRSGLFGIDAPLPRVWTT